MRIKSIGMKNYRCFENTEINLNERLTVIVGNNGSGKSSVLEAIAIAVGTFFSKMDVPFGNTIRRRDARLKSYRMDETDDVQPQYPVEIKACGTIGDREIEWKRSLNNEKGKTTFVEAKQMTAISSEYQKRLRDGDQKLILPVIAYYGTGRLWDYHKEKRADTFRVSTRTNGYIDCLDGTANIKLMLNWFQKRTVQTAQKSASGLNAFLQLPVVYHAMKLCYESVSGYKDVKFEYNMDTGELDCYYLDHDGMSMRLPLSQMSDGYKSTISLVADIAYRMAVLNPQLGTAVIEGTDGVVLIDEIDLHLHPKWQHCILTDLQKIFPKVQFIVTTHAPAVISSAKSENLVIFDGYLPDYVDTEIFGNDINSILTDIMGVSSRNPSVAGKFDEFNDLMKEEKFDEAEKILDSIDEDRDYHDKEVAANRVKLKLERIRRGI